MPTFASRCSTEATRRLRLCSCSCFSPSPYDVILKMFLDSHAHLDGSQFASDREATIQRAYDAGVRALLAIGNGDGPDDLACDIPFAERYPWIYASAGVHPHEARLLTPAHLVTMERLARHPKVIAIGEIGLDYWYDYSPRDVQQRVFRQQLELAAAVKLPILIHCRPSQNSDNAWDDLLAILREHWPPTGLSGVMHCFTGNLPQAQASLDLGFTLSFAGNISYPKAQNIRDAAAMVPLDRFFLETDCPYLAPIPYRGKRNEPAFVVETSRHFAQLRDLTPEAAGELALENFRRFFQLMG
jgi:TatD DNase family protein